MAGTHAELRIEREPWPEADGAFKADLIELIPYLRAFARTLCGRPDMADDLAQDALVKAWQSRTSFTAGTNMKAWLFTILRNQFYSDRRRAWRQAPWDQELVERIPAPGGEQSWAAELSDTVRALSILSDEQREALILVGAGGFSYEDASKICGCAVGTVKSRVARARRAIIAALEGDETLPAAATGDPAGQILSALGRLVPRDGTKG